VTRRRAASIVLALALVPAALAGCGGDDDEEEAVTPPAPAETAAGGEEGAPAEPQGDPAAGKTIFADAGCGNCHTLADAGAAGSVGPNLDDLAPDFETVEAQVREGGGGMPAFADSLSAQQIADVSAYVSSVAGS
jgi:mono/diheme cytochrome c family protein